MVKYMEISPVGSRFLTSSLDRTVMVWSLDTPHEDVLPEGLIDMTSKKEMPIVAYDPKGLVFGIVVTERFGPRGHDGQVQIRLYNASCYERGTFMINMIESHPVTQMIFSSDGKNILLTTKDTKQLVLLDAYTLNKRRTFGPIAENISQSLSLTGAFSPDGRYVAASIEFGGIIIWDLEGNEVAKIDGHPEMPSQIRFSPRYPLLASACKNLILWLPRDWVTKPTSTAN